MPNTARQNIAEGVLNDLFSDHDLTKAERKVFQAALNEFLPDAQKIKVDGDFGSGTAQGIINYFKATENYPVYYSMDRDFHNLLSQHSLSKAYNPGPHEVDGMTSLTTRDILTAQWPLGKDHIGWLQDTLGIKKTDGDYGPGTARAVLDYFKANTADLKNISPSIVRRTMAIDERNNELEALLKKHAPNALDKHIRELLPVAKTATGPSPAVLDLQAMLKAKGLYNGELTGENNSGLTKAIRSFETGKPALSAMNESFIEKSDPNAPATTQIATTEQPGLDKNPVVPPTPGILPA